MSRVITIDPGISKCGVIIADIKKKKFNEAVVIKKSSTFKNMLEKNNQSEKKRSVVNWQWNK